MPQLKSGRHVGISADPLIKTIKFGTDVHVSAVIMAYRMSVTSPDKLKDFLSVAYFREGEGTPPDAPSYDSGFFVRDVLAGKADWSEDEVQEFRTWLDTNEKINAWIAREFEVINAAIRDNLVWNTPLWTDDESPKADQ
jgi:hypothetical protein